MINITIQGMTFVQAVAALTALFGGVALIISYSVYRGHIRQLRLTANERLMEMVINIDKVMIDNPELMCLMRPDEFALPAEEDLAGQAKLRAFMYMHLNMFDVAFNYYCRTLGMTPFKRKFLRSNEENDHWEGWERYMSWFVKLPFVEEQYGKEAWKWYGPQFRLYLCSLNPRLPTGEEREGRASLVTHSLPADRSVGLHVQC
jgi:hypothetical protein